jgi:predicted restriction endonuclease
MFVSDQSDLLFGSEESAPERESAARGVAPPAPGALAQRRTTVIEQIIRRGENRRFLQTIYEGECQISGVKLFMPDGSFSIDCAHIRPLGIPHSGLDDVSNMLSLSPTMHRLFDRGCVRIHPETHAITLLHGNEVPHRQKLLIRGSHVIQKGNLSYHLSKIIKGHISIGSRLRNTVG